VDEELIRASKQWKPLTELLDDLIGRVAAAIPGCLGAGLSIRHGDGPVIVLAAQGLAAHLASAQDRVGGPILDAAVTGEAVVTDDAFADPRWPELTEQNLAEAHPQVTGWERVRGVAALPALWDDDAALVLSGVLDRPADPGTLAVLQRYERLTAAMLVVAESATTDDSEKVLGMLASRAAIEEAKGAIIAVRYCSPDEAWAILSRASQEFNVKVRELAVALVEELGNASAPQPEGTPEIVPAPSARKAAQLLWAALTSRR
jgi:ANTAR domain